MLSNAEVIAKLIQSNPIGAELLLKNYENIIISVSGDTITHILISQASCEYNIQFDDRHQTVEITVTCVEYDKPYITKRRVDTNLSDLLFACEMLPAIDRILEPRATPSFEVLRRYAYKIHEYCNSMSSCDDCDFKNKNQQCPFRRDDSSGICPSDWVF